MHSVEFCALTTGLASSQSVDSIFCAIEMVVFDEYRDSLVIFFQNEHRTLFIDFQTFFANTESSQRLVFQLELTNSFLYHGV